MDSSSILRHSTISRAFETQSDIGQVDLAIVLPAYNEAENLLELLPRAPREMLGQRVCLIVVDDGSSDRTAAVARKLGAFVVRSPVNMGGGYAIQLGFMAARRMKARYLVTMDADGQHLFKDLPTIVGALLESDVDVVIGSRNLGRSIQHETVRAAGLSLFNIVLSFLVGGRITDCSSGYRGFRMARLDRLQLRQQRHHTAEMIIEASRRGLELVEVPITIRPRHHGESKKGANWLYGLRFAFTILNTWWR